MPTYDNPTTGVVHWMSPRRLWNGTACHFLAESIPSWNWANYDPVGVPADVTCCKCRETAAWLGAVNHRTSHRLESRLGGGTAVMECKQCGQCCINNGLIPPLVPDEEAPEWLWCLVNRLKTTELSATSEQYPCVFLTDDLRCSIHEMARPSVCVEFLCGAAEAEEN